ncbi:unnamed protein product [Urochloa decumbens]|uniref:Disease resistance R13L4/SHOC-2-like LRR domain-containing protein n=1 Tax=Urochloa decumbens TaxID=240449 RepID=A0ABC9AJ88_9POAL
MCSRSCFPLSRSQSNISMDDQPSASEEGRGERVVDPTLEQALGSLVSLHKRCSEMLRGRRVTGDLELRCLAFIDKELSCLIAALSSAARPPVAVDTVTEKLPWLEKLTGAALVTLRYALGEADPQRQTLLRNAAQCFRRRHPYPYRLLSAAGRFYRLAEHPCRYGTMSLRPKEDIFELWAARILRRDWWDWFQRLVAPSSVFPHEINLLLPTLYMNMFPYGYTFDKDQLVMKWSLEGLSSLGVSLLPLAGTEEQKDEAKADLYFEHLVKWNAITRAAAKSRRNNPDEDDEVWEWNVNQIQHQLAAAVSARMGFVFTSTTLYMAAASATDHGNEASRISRIPRRLALHHEDPIPSLLQTIDLSQIRSLAVSGAVSCGVPVDKFVNLVVLDVEGWKNFNDDDLLQVCRSKMLFLVYLSIRNTPVSKLPPEMKELCSLQILDASYTLVTELPFGVFVATRLRRLDIRGTPIRQVTLPKQTLGLQDSFRVLLLGDEGIINSAETTVTRPPHDIRRFRNLETLTTVDLSQQPASFINALGDLECLRVLAITWSFHQSSDRGYCEALLSSIERWSYTLWSLTIHCGFGCSMEFLGSLSGGPIFLKKFKVKVGRFASIPRWFHGLAFLSFVQITVCKLEAHDLEILRDLPKLERLILGLDFIAREPIVIENEGFYELQRFSIDCPVPLLTFESGAMKKLTYLELKFFACPTRQISAPLLGISNLYSLEEVALRYNVRYANSSSVKMTVEAVRKEVANHHNAQMISLFINGIEQYGVQAGAGAENAAQAVHEITET